MNNKLALILLALVMLAACTPSAAAITATTEPATATLPPTPFLTLTPSATFTSTPAPTASPTPSLVPSPTSLPPISISYYLLRLEYATHSDWTRLRIVDAPGILSYKITDIQGNPSQAEVCADGDGTYRFELNRPPSQVSKEPVVSMIVDFAVSADAPWTEMHLVQDKGAWYYSQVRLYLVQGTEDILIQEFKQYPEHAERRIDLNLLQETMPTEKLVYPAVRERMVWAFYYPWYRGKTTGWGGWEDPMYTDKPLDRYSSKNYRSIKNQVVLAQSAGIDGFIVSFSGPGEPDSDCFKNLLTVSAERGFHIAFIVEGANYGSGTEPGSEAQSLERMENWLRLIFTTYADQPGYMKVNGKPLILFHGSSRTPLAVWNDLFTRLRAEGMDATYWGHGYALSMLTVFDGTHEYGGLTSADGADEIYDAFSDNLLYAQIFQESATPKMWAAAVSPGFDNTPMGRWFGWPVIIIPRNDGQTYRDSFEAAIRSNADWVFITSWNEFQENTHIEPSDFFGDFYLNLTREYARKFKGR